MCNGSNPLNRYEDPPAPVHVVTGSAGCQSGEDPFQPLPNPWSAFHSRDYGYTALQVFNSTHLYFEQISVKDMPDKRAPLGHSVQARVIDKNWVVKRRHGAGLFQCHSQRN